MIKYGSGIILSLKIMEGCITLQYDYIMVWGSYLIIILSPIQIMEDLPPCQIMAGNILCTLI
jgi:hypothetical protein